MKDAGSREKRESGGSISWGSVENAKDKLNCCVRVDPVAYLNTARGGRGRRAAAASGRRDRARPPPPCAGAARGLRARRAGRGGAGRGGLPGLPARCELSRGRRLSAPESVKGAAARAGPRSRLCTRDL